MEKHKKKRIFRVRERRKKMSPEQGELRKGTDFFKSQRVIVEVVGGPRVVGRFLTIEREKKEASALCKVRTGGGGRAGRGRYIVR